MKSFYVMDEYISITNSIEKNIPQIITHKIYFKKNDGFLA